MHWRVHSHSADLSLPRYQQLRGAFNHIAAIDVVYQHPTPDDASVRVHVTPRKCLEPNTVHSLRVCAHAIQSHAGTLFADVHHQFTTIPLPNKRLIVEHPESHIKVHTLSCTALHCTALHCDSLLVDMLAESHCHHDCYRCCGRDHGQDCLSIRTGPAIHCHSHPRRRTLCRMARVTTSTLQSAARCRSLPTARIRAPRHADSRLGDIPQDALGQPASGFLRARGQDVVRRGDRSLATDRTGVLRRGRSRPSAAWQHYCCRLIGSTVLPLLVGCESIFIPSYLNRLGNTSTSATCATCLIKHCCCCCC
jgi:hypothetical protein